MRNVLLGTEPQPLSHSLSKQGCGGSRGEALRKFRFFVGSHSSSSANTELGGVVDRGKGGLCLGCAGRRIIKHT